MVYPVDSKSGNNHRIKHARTKTWISRWVLYSSYKHCPLELVLSVWCVQKCLSESTPRNHFLSFLIFLTMALTAPRTAELFVDMYLVKIHWGTTVMQLNFALLEMNTDVKFATCVRTVASRLVIRVKTWNYWFRAFCVYESNPQLFEPHKNYNNKADRAELCTMDVMYAEKAFMIA